MRKKVKFQNYESKIVSCYETDKNFLVCFYLNSSKKYTMLVLNYELTIENETKIDDGDSNVDLFFKCVHFFGEIGVFGYFKDSKFQFKFKEYIDSNNNIVDRFETTEIKLNYDFDKETLNTCDMIKANDKKFYFVGILSVDRESLIVMSIVNYDGEKLAKRIYIIPTKMYLIIYLQEIFVLFFIIIF